MSKLNVFSPVSKVSRLPQGMTLLVPFYLTRNNLLEYNMSILSETLYGKAGLRFLASLMLGCFLFFPKIIMANEYPVTIKIEASFAQEVLNKAKAMVFEMVAKDHFIVGTSEFLAPCPGGSGTIGGQVFGDFNYNGSDDQVGYLPDIIVNIFGCDGDGDNQLIGTTTSDTAGHYFFSGLDDGTQYRLEFIVPNHLPSYQEAFIGDNGGAIQFITAPSCDAHAAFTHPQDYCEADPPMVATCFVNGDPLANGAEAASEDVLVGFNWEDSGTSPLPDHIATAEELGSCYGLGYHRSTKIVYTSAFIKRHVGLGPLGIGGIYHIDMTDPGNPVVAQFVDVESIGVDVGSISSNSDRGLPTILDDPSNDAEAYAKIGRQGIGGLDVSEDGKIWFVNMHDKKLYSIVIDSDNNSGTAPTSGDVASFDIPDPNCTGGEFRPFAVKVFRDTVYVGGTCDAFTSQNKSDLSVVIYKKVGNSFTEIFNGSLDFDKGWPASADNCEDFSGWYPWKDEIPPNCSASGPFYVYPQPILGEMEFDIDGTIIAGFIDRAGHQLGYRNWPLVGNAPLHSNVSGGDLLRLDNNNGTYEMESNGTAGGITTAGAGNSQGPGGGEFYYEDIFAGPSDNILPPPHAETSQGGLAFYPGAGEVATTATDPYSTLFNSGGINWMNNTTGEVKNPGYVLYRSTNSSISNFGKANGLGGLVVLCADDPPLQIGDYVWQDLDSDGIQDACEPALIGVNVSLYDETGSVLQTVQTNTKGQFSFSNLNPNTTYYLVAGTNGQFDPNTAQLNGSLFVTINDVGDGNDPDKTDSDAQIAGSIAGGAFTGMPYIEIQTGSAGYVSNSDDFGFSGLNVNPVAGIGGFVWEDTNKDGIQDGSESGIEGVTVKLFNDSDVEVDATVSDASGNYFFSNVDAGNYYVSFDESTNTGGITTYENSPQDQGGDDTLDSDPNVLTGQTATFAFDPINGNTNDVDAGFFQNVGIISGFVWEDTNQDGIQDVGETGIEGVSVSLIDDSNGSTIATTTTDASGNYAFNDTPPGTYLLEFDESTNTLGVTSYEGSPQNQGGDDTLDSDPNPGNGQTITFAFDPINGDIDDFDAGFFQNVGTISGFVWDDINQDGIQNGGEPGIEGVTIDLIDDSDDSTIATTSSDASGNYNFIDVSPGTYIVVFDPSTNANGISNYNGSPQDQGGDDNLDSDPNPGNGQTDPIAFNPSSDNLSNLDAGFFVPLGTLSGFVWDDVDQDGVQDGGELGIEGVTVSLINNSNGSTVQSTTTNAGGNYAFSNVELGNYILNFDASTNTSGISNYNGSPLDQGGDDTIDSDADPDTGNTKLINYDPNNGNLSNIDAGYFAPTGTVSGFVWEDANEDGLQSGGEPGIEGVSVTLYDANTDVQIQNTTTSSDGSYDFTNVSLGDYYIVFDESTNTGGVTDYVGTIQNAGDDSIDSDADPNTGQTDDFSFDPEDGISNISAGYFIPTETIGGFVWNDIDMDGIQDNGEPGIGDVTISLFDDNDDLVATTISSSDGSYGFPDVPVGDYYLVFDPSTTGNDDYEITLQDQGNDDAKDSDANPNNGATIIFSFDPNDGSDHSWSAGFVLPFGSIGDFVFKDCNGNGIQDGGEDGLANVPVSLLSGATTLETTTTNASGFYQFTNIQSGTYTVKFEFPDAPDGLDFSPQNQGGDDDLDSDAAPNTGETQAFTLAGGEVKSDIDAGMVDNQAPSFVNPPNDVVLPCDDPQITDPPTLTAIDNCDDDVSISFNETTNGGSGGGGCDGGLEIIRTWTATDDCGNTFVHTQTISTGDEVAPVIIGIPDVTVECDDLPDNEDVKAVDDCDLDVELTYTDSIIMDGACMQMILRKWTATDDCGNMTMNFQKIYTEDNTAPEITLIHPLLENLTDGSSLTIECDQAEAFDEDDASVMDNCDPDVMMEFMKSEEDGDCTEDGYLQKITLKWSAEDNCGNSSILTITIFITDSTPPGVANVPLDITVGCDEIPTPANPSFTDDCDSDIAIEFEEIIIGDTCTNYKILRTWTGTDDCGNFIIAGQTIDVEIIPLELMGVPDDITVDCTDIPDPANVTANETCFDVTIDFNEIFLDGGCIDKIIRTWTATNNCGDEVIATQTITTEDNAAPEIILIHPDLQGVMEGETLIFECDNILNFNENDAEAIDECDNNLTISFMEMPIIGDCDVDGYLARLECCWKAEDDCGNLTQFCIFVEIIDNTNPVLSGVPADLTIDLFNGETVPPVANVTALDNCDLDVDLEFIETTLSNSDNCGFTTTRTWIATDDCGQLVSESQIITATDICDCPNILINDFSINNTGCGLSEGAISIDFALDPSNYDLDLSPNLGTLEANGFSNLPFGNYELTITVPSIQDCEEKIFFDILQIGCKDTMEVLINEIIEVCVDSTLFDFTGSITAANIIDEGNILTVMASDIDENCVTLHPGTGYLGTSPDLICLELCFNNSMAQCDTTYLKVTVEEKPILCQLEFAGIEISQPDCNDKGGSIKAEVIGNEGLLAYQWTPNISNTFNATDLSSGTYELLVMDVLTECSLETSITLTAPTPVRLDISDVQIIKPICPESDGSIISQTNIQYQIYNDQNEDIGFTPMTHLTPGIYTLVHSNGDCEASIEIEIEALDDWDVELIIMPETCTENDGSLTLNVSGANGGYLYHWDGFISTTNQATGLTEGTYSVTIQDAVGCLYTMENMMVDKDCDVIPCTLDISIDNKENDQCDQSIGSVQLLTNGAQGNVSYSWDPVVSMTDAAFGLPAGNYQIIALDDLGCSDILNIEIENVQKDWTLDYAAQNESCLEKDGHIVLQIDGLGFNYTFDWAGAISNSSIADNLSAGIYEVTVADDMGCSETLQIEIEKDLKNWSVNPQIIDASCDQSDGSIYLEITGSTNLTYYWSSGVSNTNEASGLTPGTYSITIEDNLDCSEILDIEIDGSQKTWSASEIHSNVSCIGNDGSIELQIANDPGNLVFQWTPDISTSNIVNGLSQGIYEVFISDHNDCSEIITIEIETEPTPNWDSQITSTGESCHGNDGSILLQISGGNGNLSYQWSPPVSTTHEAIGLNANTLYDVTIIDATGCVFELNDLAIDNNCNPTITMETVNQTILCGFSTSQLCTSLSELPGSFDALLVCGQPSNGSLSFVSDTCLMYEANPDFEGLEQICLVLCDEFGFCDTTRFEIFVEACPVTAPCEEMFGEDYQILATNDCDVQGQVCFPIPFDDVLGYSLMDNGDLFAHGVDGCLHDTTLAYSYINIPGLGLNGPYQVNSWNINGQLFSGTFNSIEELMVLLNQWDINGNWVLDTLNHNIFGGAIQNTYSSLQIAQSLTGAIAELNLNMNLIPKGAVLFLPVGMHELTLTVPNTNCADTTTVEMVCIEKETLLDTIRVNQSKNTCIDLSQLPGDLMTSEIICHDCDNATFNIEDDCINFTGQIPGKDLVFAVLCDDLGFCDTTIFKITVYDDGKPPVVKFDADTTQRMQSTLIDVLANDELNGEFRSLNLIENSTNAETHITQDNLIAYAPKDDFCGLDAFAYSLCNEIDCDTATVSIYVRCDTPEPKTAFSPNNDGINDGFRIIGIEQYPDNQLSVFNRWGQIVYRKEQYENNVAPWKGTYNSYDLPDGTYFYVLEYGNGNRLTGYVEIRR